MPIWTFVRHGQSVSNQERWFAGHHDSPLTEQGRDQARAAAADLVEPRPTRAFCSDLSRAHETARLILTDLDIPLTVTPELRERDCGVLERRSVVEVRANPDYAASLANWTGRPPGGESLLEVALRAVGWATTVDDDSEEDTLVVAHGALIFAVLTGLDRRPRSDPGRRPNNCEIFRREVAKGAWNQLLDELRREASETGGSRIG